jgi:coatomer subunit beta
VQQYDIVLEVLVLNRTPDTLQSVSLELSTMGDLKLCERPQNYTIAPFGAVQIKADIKVRACSAIDPSTPLNINHST